MKERVYRFRIAERECVAKHPGMRVLDVGCGVGDNLTRLVRYGARPLGIDPARERVAKACSIAPSVVARGESLPWRDCSFDMVYISHVLHHASDLHVTLAEVHRVLRDDGTFFVIETVDDSPLMRLARWLEPRWQGDPVEQRFRFAELWQDLESHGFEVQTGQTFNWMYFAWELLPLAFRPLEFLTPIFIGIERLFGRWLDRWGGHCWLIARKPADGTNAAAGSSSGAALAP